ncbi:MAG: SurA N-terminal domain-containing protein [Pseudomonadota bacterium]|nr:SurA N-terminal domain-containing protein [Pseudomonadota bacterium]
MLQDIRDNAQSTIAKVIVGLLIVSLSIWGMDAIIGGFSGEPEVATVNGQDITEREFLRTVQLETQQRMMQMDNPDPSMLDEDRIRREVLEALIQEEVLTQDAQSQGLELSEADIDVLITQMPQFQVDGQFNSDRFVAAVRNMGMGVGEFRQMMRTSYVTNQIRAAISQSAVVAPQNADHLLAIQDQTRDFRIWTVDAADVADRVSVTDEAVEAYYQDNRDQFREAEQVDASYITLSLGELAESIEIAEDDLRAYYEQQAEEYAREERRAAHILIEAGADAEETMATIQQRLADGESFAALAEEFSIDTVSAEQGGDLGFAGRGVYDEAFENALFALEAGEVSEPVETTFGVHLIRLEEVRRSEPPTFEELREELRAELARAQASERFAEVRTQLADAVYTADDLAGPAEELGLEVRQADGVTRDGGQAPFDHDGLVRQLFSEDVLQAGYNTELIDVGDNVSVVARVREYREPRQQELAEVRDEIVGILEAEAIRDALSARADEVLAGVESGELSTDEWQAYDDQGRGGADLSTYVLQKVFSMPRPEGGDNTTGKAVSSEQAAVVVLEAVNDGEVNRESPEYTQLRQFLGQLEGQREYTAYQQYLRNQAEIERP